MHRPRIVAYCGPQDGNELYNSISQHRNVEFTAFGGVFGELGLDAFVNMATRADVVLLFPYIMSEFGRPDELVCQTAQRIKSANPRVRIFVLHLGTSCHEHCPAGTIHSWFEPKVMAAIDAAAR